jgi:hypothetical protein
MSPISRGLPEWRRAEHFHHLLNDVDREVVMADINAWFNKRILAGV